MPIIKFYFTPALLLLAFSCPLLQVSLSLPVMTTTPMTDSCVINAHTLLQNITDALTQDTLFKGFDCMKQSVELNTKTDTPSVCAPKGSTCSGISKSEFNQESCLTNIKEDLHHYYKFLTTHPDPDNLLGHTVLQSLKDFMQNCFQWPQSINLVSAQGATDRPSTFNERLSLCKVLKGFHVRTVTINRALGYMNSGEHTR